MSDPRHRRPVFPGNGVHLWTVRLDRSVSEYDELIQLLDADERSRAARFVFAQDRHRYVVCRGTLRLVLSQYLGQHPADIRFSYGNRGKPALAVSTSEVPVHFNVSHAAGVAVYALTEAGEIGVDVEWLGRRVEYAELAARFFGAEESSELRSLPFALQASAFFNCWTRKEAYIKAIGDGLACPLSGFSVTLRPGEDVRLRSIGGDRSAGDRWTLRSFSPFPGFVGALAVRSPLGSVELRSWPWFSVQGEDAQVANVEAVG